MSHTMASHSSAASLRERLAIPAPLVIISLFLGDICACLAPQVPIRSQRKPASAHTAPSALPQLYLLDPQFAALVTSTHMPNTMAPLSAPLFLSAVSPLPTQATTLLVPLEPTVMPPRLLARLVPLVPMPQPLGLLFACLLLLEALPPLLAFQSPLFALLVPMPLQDHPHALSVPLAHTQMSLASLPASLARWDPMLALLAGPAALLASLELCPPGISLLLATRPRTIISGTHPSSVTSAAVVACLAPLVTTTPLPPRLTALHATQASLPPQLATPHALNALLVRPLFLHQALVEPALLVNMQIMRQQVPASPVLPGFSQPIPGSLLASSAHQAPTLTLAQATAPLALVDKLPRLMEQAVALLALKDSMPMLIQALVLMLPTLLVPLIALLALLDISLDAKLLVLLDALLAHLDFMPRRLPAKTALPVLPCVTLANMAPLLAHPSLARNLFLPSLLLVLQVLLLLLPLPPAPLLLPLLGRSKIPCLAVTPSTY